MLKHLKAKKAMRNYKESRSESGRLKRYKELSTFTNKPITEIIHLLDGVRTKDAKGMLFYIRADISDLSDCVSDKDVRDELRSLSKRLMKAIEVLESNEE